MTDGDIPTTKSKSSNHLRNSNGISMNKESIVSTSQSKQNPSVLNSLLHSYAVNGDKVRLQEALRNDPELDVNGVDQLGRTPLAYAVFGDRIECVSILLKAGANINIGDTDERSALHWASYQGNHKLVKLLVSKGADLLKQDKEGKTALHFSTTHDNIKVMETLLRSMAPPGINFGDNDDITPLFWSVFYGQISHTQLLLKYRASASQLNKESQTVLHWASQSEDPVKSKDIFKLLIDNIEGETETIKLLNWPDSGGRTVLHMAISRLNMSLVQFILTLRSLEINKGDKVGSTPLHYAAKLGNAELVTILLEHGGDHKISDNNGVYPLQYAVQSNSVDTVRTLLDHQGVLDLPCNEHSTALMWAASTGSIEIMKLLLERKCSDVNAADHLQQTALHKCTQAGHLDCVKMLIQYGAEVDFYDSKHHIPLFNACAAGHKDIVNELLSNGSSSKLDERDHDGRCPIHFAAMKDRTDIMEILLEHNSNINTQDNEGCTALHFAALLGFVNCISVLLKNGADVDLPDFTGRTALHLASRMGSVNAVKLLVSQFNAKVNMLTKEDQTPLDYAITEDRQDVAVYLHEETKAYTATNLKNFSATKIQATWKGYHLRKTLRNVKPDIIRHETERKNAFGETKTILDGENINEYEFNANKTNLVSPCESGKSQSDNDSQEGQSYPESSKYRSAISSPLGHTGSPNSSVFLPHEKSKDHDCIHLRNICLNENHRNFDDLSSQSSRQVTRSVRKVSRNVHLNKDELRGHDSVHLLSKRDPMILPSFSIHSRHPSPINSSSSSEVFTNIQGKKNDERNNILVRGYSRYATGTKDLAQFSSSESSAFFRKAIVTKDKETSFVPRTSVSKFTIQQQQHKQKQLFLQQQHQFSQQQHVEQHVEIKQRTNITKNAETYPVVILPDQKFKRTWNIYRSDQKRISIIREQTTAAIKIQKAFRLYLKEKKQEKSTDKVATKECVVSPDESSVSMKENTKCDEKTVVVPMKENVDDISNDKFYDKKANSKKASKANAHGNVYDEKALNITTKANANDVYDEKAVNILIEKYPNDNLYDEYILDMSTKENLNDKSNNEKTVNISMSANDETVVDNESNEMAVRDSIRGNPVNTRNECDLLNVLIEANQGEASTADNVSTFSIEENVSDSNTVDVDDIYVEEVAALYIQLAWRKYVKKKLLLQQSGKFIQHTKHSSSSTLTPVKKVQKTKTSDGTKFSPQTTQLKIESPPNCKSPTLSNSTKMKSPTKSNSARNRSNYKPTSGKKVHSSKGAKVK